MKILYLVLSEAIGGLELISEIYFKELVNRGIDIMFMLKKDSHLHKHLSSYGARIIPLDISESKFSLKLIKQLRNIINDFKIDIVHVHTRIDIWPASIAIRGLDVKLVYTSYNYIENTYKRDLLHRFIYGKCDLITVFSEAQRKGFCKCLPVKKEIVKIIPNGINIQKFNPDLINKKLIRESLGLSGDDLVVGTVGRVMENKGQWMLIKIANRLIKSFPNLRLLFIGADSKGEKDDYFRNLLIEVKNLGLEDKIIFTGFRTDIPECLSAMDVFVLASQCENFGTSLLEAMAMRKACLGTNSGGTPEILDFGNAGILFEYGNIENLYIKLLELLKNDNLRIELGEKAQKRVLENYTLNKTMDILINTYHNLI